VGQSLLVNIAGSASRPRYQAQADTTTDATALNLVLSGMLHTHFSIVNYGGKVKRYYSPQRYPVKSQ